MTKNSSPKKKHHAPKRHWGISAFIPLLLTIGAGIVTTVLAVERKDLPASIRDTDIVVQAYKMRDDTFGLPAPETEHADKAPGYSGRERDKLDELISKGARDH